MSKRWEKILDNALDILSDEGVTVYIKEYDEFLDKYYLVPLTIKKLTFIQNENS